MTSTGTSTPTKVAVDGCALAWLLDDAAAGDKDGVVLAELDMID